MQRTYCLVVVCITVVANNSFTTSTVLSAQARNRLIAHYRTILLEFIDSDQLQHQCTNGLTSEQKAVLHNFAEELGRPPKKLLKRNHQLEPLRLLESL